MPELIEVRFAPNQTLPPGYRVVFPDDGGLGFWENERGEQGLQSWNRFWIRRCA